MPWKQVKRIIEKVHKHVFRHASLTDFRALLERNNLWNSTIANYVSRIVSECRECRSTAPPIPSRKDSISTMTMNFNEVVCVDHLILDEIHLLHCMDTVSRYSTAFIVGSANMYDAIFALQASWISTILYLDHLLVDKAFKNNKFQKYLESRGIKFRIVPSGRHSKNVIESKHKTIRSIYIRLKKASASDFNAKFCAVEAVRISNDLHGNDKTSAFELARGFTNPISHNTIIRGSPHDIITAQDQLQARRKLRTIFTSKSTTEPAIYAGDSVKVVNNKDHGKKGSWSTPKIVLVIDHESGTLTVPGNKNNSKTIAYEDTHPTPIMSDLSKLVSKSIYYFDNEIQNALLPIDENANEENEALTETNDNTSNRDFTSTTPNIETSIGDRIAVYWPLDEKYYDGVVESIGQDGKNNILYNENDRESLKLK